MQMSLKRLLKKNMSGYDEKGGFENAFIETLQKHISTILFRHLLSL